MNIKHLKKDDLVKEIKKQIILFTPLGFLPQSYKEGEKDAWGLGGTDFQEHKSGWLLEDFDNSWEIFCVNEFHFKNGKEIPFKKPYGAFFAIKNKSYFNNNPKKMDYLENWLNEYSPRVLKKIVNKFSKTLIKKKVFR